MRNLFLTHCKASENTILKECEAFQEDPTTGVIYVACPSSIYSLDLNSLESHVLAEWGDLREGARIVDFQLTFDTDELVTVLSNGKILSVPKDCGEVQEVAFVGECCDASWSPDLAVLAISNDREVIFYDRLYEVICMNDLSCEARGKDELVTVGWGSKDTQFQGSAGKAAREKKVDVSLKAYDDDSHLAHVYWRADGKFVFVSFYEESSEERRVMIYNENGELMSRLKAEVSMEEHIAVKTNGNYIATTARNADGSRQMNFFERNGERRADFKLDRVDGTILGMAWDSEASIFAIVQRKEKADEIQLWTVSNYDWTRKWVKQFPERIVSWRLNVEKARSLTVVSGGTMFSLTFAFQYSVPSGSVCVVATDQFRITNLNRCLIPPPMSEYQLQHSSLIQAFACTDMQLVFIDSNGILSSYTRDGPDCRFGEPTPIPLDRQPGIVSSLCILSRKYVAFVSNGTEIWKADLVTGNITVHGINGECLVSLNRRPSDNALIAVTDNGLVFRYNNDSNWIQQFSVPASKAVELQFSSQDKVVALSGSELSVNGNLLVKDVSSFLVHEDLCIYVNLQNKLCFTSLSDLKKKIAEDRAVEAGSRLVALCGTRISLQMPRGNTESFYPRYFTVGVIKKLIDSKNYVDALEMMKKHRIDMNLLVDHDFETFLDNVDLLFGENSSSELVCLLISAINESKSGYCDSPVIDGKVDKVMMSIQTAILNLDKPLILKFFTALLSSLLKGKQPNIEEALTYIKSYTDKMNPCERDQMSRSWLHHVGFFVDEKRMFDAALATYDLLLTVQVAEASNRDPKEYLPLLNELRKVEPPAYRRYRIDVVRGDWERALTHLADCSDKFDEAVAFIKEKKLYIYALHAYKSTNQYSEICKIVAAHCESQLQWHEAAVLYRKAGMPEKVLHCLEMARDVSGFVAATDQLSVAEDKRKQGLTRIAIHLKAASRWKEAVQALKAMGAKAEEIIETYKNGNMWEEAALEALVLSEDDQAFGSLLHATLEKARSISNEAGKKLDLINKYAARLEKVRELKEQRIGHIQDGLESGYDLEDIDAFSEAGSTMSMISRRTGGTGASRASTTATMRKRKQIERKKQSLKEGGEYEDSALLLVLHAEYKWLSAVTGEVQSVLRALFNLGEVQAARELQSRLGSVVTIAQAKIIHIWPSKLQAKHLCGPLHAMYLVDGVFAFPDGNCMPDIVTIEPEMVPPPPLDCNSWKLACL